MACVNEDSLFKLQCLIKAPEIQHSAYCEDTRKVFIACATGSSEILLYYKKDPLCAPIIRRIPWFQGSHKQISSFCFHPHGLWLLCTTLDGSLYIVPVQSLVDDCYVGEKAWSTDDITSFLSVSPQLSNSRPTAVVWWLSSNICIDVAIVGTEYGEILFINLESGQQICVTHIKGSISELKICDDESKDMISLLITNQKKQQWHLILEQRGYTCLRHGENGEGLSVSSNDNMYDNARISITTRSRLQGLKQLSVEKLASLRQKLIETRNQALGDSLHYHDTTSSCNTHNSNNSESSPETNLSQMTPEHILSDGLLAPQSSQEGYQLFTCYCPSTRCIKIYAGDFSSTPVSKHRVFEATDFDTNSSRKIPQDNEGNYVLPKSVQDVKVELDRMDTCIIVTNQSVYKVILRKSLVSVFMELILKKNEVDKAIQLSSIFGMNTNLLLEQTGDIFLAKREFSRAMAFYNLSNCRLLKSVLKFASAGHTSELLNCQARCLNPPGNNKVTLTTRLHLSNLCVLAFIETTLRASPQELKNMYKEFLYFLSTNTYYDELFVVNIAGQMCLWEVLHQLATQRALYGQVLEVLIKTVDMSSTNNMRPTPYGLLICISEPSLIQAMLVNTNLARSHMKFVLDHLHDSQIFVLQRLVTLYDPSSPVVRPCIARYRARHRTTSLSSQSSQCDSIDIAENSDEGDTVIREIIETFLLILLTLIKKRLLLSADSTSMSNIQLLQVKSEHNSLLNNIKFRRRHLSSGFSHSALIRNGYIFTWGSSVRGCLGTGPTVLKYNSSQSISFFRDMCIEVFSVSCGHCHTLALTNNGVYAWGSSQFGQLGLGKVLQCSSPELITSLAEEVIIDAVAGQYHSIALTKDGRVFTWGWGVHGQLGHGSTDEKNTPTLITSLLGIFIRHISAGHAHTLVLSMEGVVYAFGCNLFGQLGVGHTNKSSIPVKILLTEQIWLIATGYFHNLAISTTNKLYMWGASPQVLRSQVRERARALEKDVIEKQFENAEVPDNSPDPINGDYIKQETVENNAQNVEVRKEQYNCSNSRNINKGLLEESQAHLKPSVVDTSSLTNEIIRVSTGCHHSALVTRDGSLYTWGRNVDGQLGHSSKEKFIKPTLVYCDPNSILTEIPPRRKIHKKLEEKDLQEELIDRDLNEKEDNVVELKSEEFDTTDNRDEARKGIKLKAVEVHCGYDYTIAVQPDGTVLAWGRNNKAQLGCKEVRSTDKILFFKPPNQVIRLPHTSHDALPPSPVPNIPAPVISFRGHGTSALAGLSRPLSVIEKLPGQLTLHYALEHFSGLYDFSRIMEKCIELGNFQACSKIAMLQHNVADAYSFQLKILHMMSLNLPLKNVPSENLHERKLPMVGETRFNLKEGSSSLTYTLKKNRELFNKQVEKNLIDSVEDCAARNRMRIPASKSLNNLQLPQEELYSFDCQGGSEELCKDMKVENTSLDIRQDSFEDGLNADSDVWIDDIDCENELSLKEGVEVKDTANNHEVCNEKIVDPNINLLERDRKAENEEMISHKRKLDIQRKNLTNEVVKVVKFFLHEIKNESCSIKCEILQRTLEFWIEHDLPVQSLENLLLEHISMVYYPLGLLLFCQDIMEKYLDTNENVAEASGLNMIDVFSTKFSLEICSMLVQHIGEGCSAPEYVKLLSSLTADHYGPPLTGYPGSSGNNTSKQMIEGILSTVSSKTHDSRSFIHIKDPDAVYRFLATEEETMVFTCGHHFPLTAYKTEVIPAMETELLTSESVILPRTAQYLGNMLSQTLKPEIICPLCIPRALEAIVKKNKGNHKITYDFTRICNPQVASSRKFR
ncbi:hypothetical protein KM043_015595 [Ampulex compressa]|nr:hypothetical protein KM043_015595 [Ampulex compressa]